MGRFGKFSLFFFAIYALAILPAIYIKLIDPAPISKGKALWLGIADSFGGLSLLHPSVAVEPSAPAPQKFGFVRMMEDDEYLCREVNRITREMPSYCENLGSARSSDRLTKISPRELHKIAIGLSWSRLALAVDSHSANALEMWIEHQLPTEYQGDKQDSIVDRSLDYTIEFETQLMLGNSSESLEKRRQIFQAMGISRDSPNHPRPLEIMNYMAGYGGGSVDSEIALYYFARLLKMDNPLDADISGVIKEAQRQAREESDAAVVRQMWGD
jgi:hypothetical protein